MLYNSKGGSTYKEKEVNNSNSCWKKSGRIKFNLLLERSPCYKPHLFNFN
jgi:hypothetical protein